MNEHDFDGDRPRQLLVCTFGADCGAALKQRDGNAQDLGDALKTARTEAGLKRQLYVIKTGCQGWCEHAPVLQLLPEGRVFKAPEISAATATVQACVDGGKQLADSQLWDYSQPRTVNEARRKGQA